MYWIPAIFVLCEILFLLNIPNHMKTLAFNKFLEKIKKEREKEKRVEKLKNWSNNPKYVMQKKLPLPKEKKGIVFFGFYYLVLLIYFIIGLFYPIWWLSVIIFSTFIVSVLFSRIFFGSGNFDDMFLDYNDFDDNIIPQKMERKIKLSNIDNNYHNLRKIILTKTYLFSLIRLSASVAVIVLHQYGMV